MSDVAATPVAPIVPPAPRAPNPLVERLLAPFRDPNPILVKELRATFRTALFVRFLYLSTFAVGLVVLTGGATVAAADTAPAEVGQIVFQIFFATALFVIALVAPAYASTSITIEREQRTYEGLLLSNMSPAKIVHGKFVASYASIVLVLIALAPAVGIAFLFGGVSLWHVVYGYAGLLLWLAPAIGFGIALSARLPSTRVAIVLAVIVFSPVAFVATLTIGGLGELAKDAWGTGFEGPFWFTDALVNRLFELDTFALVVLFPLYLFLMPTWFFLATAVSGLQPPAEDRSSPLKVWGVAFVVLTAFIVTALTILPSGASDRGPIAVVFVLFLGPLLFLFAMLYANEPPLPPRPSARPSLASRLFAPIGPGAGPTLRFSGLAIASFVALLTLGPSLVRHVMEPGYGDHVRYDAALIVCALGNGAIALCIASLSAWLRTTLRNGVAARVLTVAIFLALVILPFLGMLVIDPDMFEKLDEELPVFILLSPMSPTILAVNLIDKDMGVLSAAMVLVPAVVYGGFSALFWVLVEARVLLIKRASDAQRAAREKRAQQAGAPQPILDQVLARRSSVPTPAVAPTVVDPAPIPTPEPSAAAADVTDPDVPKPEPE